MSTGYPFTLGSSAGFLNDQQDTYPGTSDSFLSSQYPGQLGKKVTLGNDEALNLTNLSTAGYSSSTPLKGGTYQYVRMTSSVTITAARGVAVYWKAGQDGNFVVTTDAPTGGTQFAGFLINALAVNKYGWILIEGAGYALGKASSLTNTGAVGQLMSIVAAAGTVDNPLAANFTDSTTGSATATTLAAGVGKTTLAVYFRAAAITGNVLLFTYTPGYKFKITRISAACVDAVTTGAKAATLTTAIAGTPTTGGIVVLSGTYALGAEQASSAAVTALNTGTSAQAITITASSVTAFVEGGFMVYLEIQNMDTADAVASMANFVASLRSALLTRIIAYEAPVAATLKQVYIAGGVPVFSPGIQ